VVPQLWGFRQIDPNVWSGRASQEVFVEVSADGSTVCVLILRLNSSCSRSIALVVRALRHWLGGQRVKVKSRSPASTAAHRTCGGYQLGHTRSPRWPRKVVGAFFLLRPLNAGMGDRHQRMERGIVFTWATAA
jgi:hypothetical protein